MSFLRADHQPFCDSFWNSLKCWVFFYQALHPVHVGFSCGSFYTPQLGCLLFQLLDQLQSIRLVDHRATFFELGANLPLEGVIQDHMAFGPLQRATQVLHQRSQWHDGLHILRAYDGTTF